MWNYHLLGLIASVLALGALMAAAPLLRRRPLWLNLAVMLAGGAAVGSLVTMIGEPLFPGHFDFDWPILKTMGLEGLSTFHLEVFSAGMLFLLCLIRLPGFLLREPKPESALVRAFLLPILFSLAYGTSFALTTYQPGQFVIATIVGVALPGLFGAALTLLVKRGRPLPRIAFPRLSLRQHGRAFARFVSALVLLTIAIVLPLLNDLRGALAYGVSYQAESGPAIKWPNKIDSYLGLADYYRDRGDIGAALALTRQSVISAPRSYAGHIQLADLLIETGQYQEAIVNLDVAITLAPTDTNAYYGRALAYESMGDYAAAVGNLGEILTLVPSEELAYLMRAGLYIRQGEYTKALADISRLDKTAAGQAALLFRGIAYIGQRDARGARESLAEWTKATGKPTNIIWSDYTSSVALAWGGTLFSRYQALDLSGSMHYTILGNAYTLYNSHDYFAESLTLTAAQVHLLTNPLRERFASGEATLKYMTPVLQGLAKSSSPADATTLYLYLGDLYSSQAHPEIALTYYQQAADLAVSSGDISAERVALNGIGDAARAMKEEDVAQKAYERSVALALQQQQPPADLVEVYYRLGLLNLDAGRFAEAIGNFSSALDLDPNHKDAAFARAQAYSRTDQFDNAIADVRYGLRLDPQWVEAHLTLGYYLSRDGQYDQAIAALQSAESLADDRPLYYHYLGYAYVGLGDRPASVSAYERSFQLIAALSSRETRVDLYEQIVADLRQLQDSTPETSAIIEDVWVMMRGAMSVQNIPSYYYPADSSSDLYARATAPISPTTVGATGTLTPTQSLYAATAATQTLWVQLAVAGPPQISPGSSDIIQIVAELRKSPGSSGTAFPVELYTGHSYSIETRLEAVNFEVGGEADSAALTRAAEIGQPVRWQWVLSPRPGYEGNQTVIYTIVVHDQDQSGWSREIPTNALLVAVPTRYGIPAQILYPLSGVAAVIAAVIALPVVNTVVKTWLERRKKSLAGPPALDYRPIYQKALAQLLAQLESHPQHHSAALVYQQRLEENLTQAQLHGDNDARKADRSEIIARLNELALATLHVSFNEMCARIESGQPLEGQNIPPRKPPKIRATTRKRRPRSKLSSF